MRWFLVPLFLLSLDLLPAPAQAPARPDAPASADPGVSAYQHVLRSSVWIQSDRGKGRVAMGSGSLVDKGRRLVLTNYHVVGDVKKATVLFPEFGADRRVIPERKYYLDRLNRLGIPGEVVEIDKDGDLALIRLDRIPEGAVELPLAPASPEPGQTVHSIGNPGKSGALWVYTPGKVRQVYSKKWQARLDDKHIQTFQARVIETDSPTNPGDSGGPLANDKGELVGVTQGGALDAQALSIFVDLSEVKRLLNRRSVQSLRTTESISAPQAKEPAKPEHDMPLKSKDEAKFFSEDAWKKVQPDADKLFKDKHIDLLIETAPTPPGSDADKVKAMKPEEREKFFRQYALQRVKAEKLSGIYIIICKSPGFVYVEITKSTDSFFPEGFGAKLKNTLLAAFKMEKFDAGLTEALDMIMNAQGLGEKKP